MMTTKLLMKFNEIKEFLNDFNLKLRPLKLKISEIKEN